MITRLVVVILSVAVFTLAGCGSLQRLSKRPPPPPPTTALADTVQAARLPYDPLAVGGDVFEAALFKAEQPQQSDSALPLPVARVGQYRVLVASYLDQQNALDACQTAMRILEVTVNVEYESPFYLVVSEWLESKSDANNLRTRALNSGFTRATVLQNKPDR